MNILVNGIGNIGTTLVSLLNKYKEILEIDTVYALKNSPMPWHQDDLDYLENQGIKVCTRYSNDGYLLIDDIIDSVGYIFDCTNNGGGMKNKEWYVDLPNLIGASAQGSEKKFGKSFMSGVNNDFIKGKKFTHIVSCNTHAIACLMSTISGNNIQSITEADFVIVRRSEDIGNHQRLVTANVVARHLDDSLGTHHSIDVSHLYETIGIRLNVTSSDVTTPSQLMHSVRFNLKLDDKITTELINNRLKQNPFISVTQKFDSNVIFERGRRIGFQGRIFSQAIVVDNNLIIDRKSIKGWAFIPQEGNTLLSTIHAFLLQIDSSKTEKAMQLIMHDLLNPQW
ncbi:MAG: hypothetical protein MK066_12770 [Crocinitomicaceae bacterium]|nr:hypothetical protein [Crocinitomicaceae bacterium]